MSQTEKAQLFRLDDKFHDVHPAVVTVDFNPTELTLTKGAHFAEVAIPGLDMPIVQFVNGQTETLNVDLFFDSTDGGMGAGANPVTECTDKLYQLVKINPDTHAPPVCRFVWGGASTFPGARLAAPWTRQRRTNSFQCVVESVRQRFTLFSPDGVPLRAVVTVSLKEYRTLDQQVTAIGYNSSDRTRSHVVVAGETLSGIAADVYGDPGTWRTIALANGILDPLAIAPGTTLKLPPVQPGARA